MKKIVITGLLMLSASVLSAQEVKPKYEIHNKMVKATYYYDNGNIKQEGWYKAGKLHGKWMAYNEDGTKQSLGEYKNGEKTGKWFFWTDDAMLSEVDYKESKVAGVRKWSSEAVVVNK